MIGKLTGFENEMVRRVSRPEKVKVKLSLCLMIEAPGPKYLRGVEV
jgi:hypothetical protein